MKEWLLWELPPDFQEAARQFFAWSGFAIWVGLTTRFLIPTKLLRGAWLTLVLGFLGACLGPLATRAFFRLENFNPVGPAGFVASTVVASLVVLFFYVATFLVPKNEAEDDELERDPAAAAADEYRRDEYDRRVEPARNEYDVPERRAEFHRDERAGKRETTRRRKNY